MPQDRLAELRARLGEPDMSPQERIRALLGPPDMEPKKLGTLEALPRLKQDLELRGVRGALNATGLMAQVSTTAEGAFLDVLELLGADEGTRKTASHVFRAMTPVGQGLAWAGEKMQGLAERIPTDTEAEEAVPGGQFAGKTAETLGSMAPMGVGAALTGGIGASAMGVALESTAMRQEAEAAGAGAGARLAATAGGAALGAIEGGLGAERVLAGLGRVLRGAPAPLKKKIITSVALGAVRSGGEESLEEAIQGTGEEAIREYVLNTSEKGRKDVMDWLQEFGEQWIDQGLPAFVIGGFVGGIALAAQTETTVPPPLTEQKPTGQGLPPVGPRDDGSSIGMMDQTPSSETVPPPLTEQKPTEQPLPPVTEAPATPEVAQPYVATPEVATSEKRISAFSQRGDATETDAASESPAGMAAAGMAEAQAQPTVAPPAEVAVESPEAGVSTTTPREKPSSSTETPAPPDLATDVKAQVDEAERTYSIKNRKVDEERERMGLAPATHGEKQTFQEWNDRAAQEFEADPYVGQKLHAELRRKMRPLEGWESAVLHREATRLGVAIDATEKAINQAGAADDAERVLELQKQQDELQSEYDSASQMYTLAGTASGQSLAARRIELREDFSLARMKQRMRAAKGGAELTEQDMQRIRDLQARLTKAEEDLDDYLRKQSEREQGAALEKATRSLERTARRTRRALRPKPVVDFISRRADEARARIKARGAEFRSGPAMDPLELLDMAAIGAEKIAKGLDDFAAWSSDMVTELGERIRPHLQEIFDRAKKAVTDFEREEIQERVKASNGDDATIRAAARSLAEMFVAEGVTERDALVTKVHETLKEAVPALSRRQTMDAISGYGDYTLLSKDEVKKRVREIRGELQQLSKLEDLAKGQAPLKTGMEHRVPTDEERKLIRQVNEAKKKFKIETVDPEHQLASALDTIKTRLRHQIDDLTRQIEAKTPDVREKTPPPSDAEIEALRAQRDALREEYDTIFNAPEQRPGHAEVLRLQAALKANQESIARLEEELRTGKRQGKEIKPGIVTPELEALRAQREKLQKQVEEARKPQQPGHTEVMRAQAAEKALAKAIADYEHRISTGDLKPMEKKAGILTPAMQALRARRDALREELKALRDAQNPKKTPDQIAAQARKTRLKNEMARLREQIARGEFSKPKKKEILRDDEEVRLMAEIETVRNEYRRGLEQERLRNRTKLEKTVDAVKESIQLVKQVWASYDLSAMFRQGGFFTFAHPIKTLTEWLPASIKAAKSEDAFMRMDTAMRSHPDHKRLIAGGLELTDLDGPLKYREEIMRSRLAEKVPGIRASNRAFITFLNLQRMAIASGMMNSAPTALSDAEVKAIALGVNEATGRGSAGRYAQHIRSAGLVLWAPSLWLSRFQILALHPLWHGSATTRKMFAKEYARAAVGLAALYALKALADDDDPTEFDPRSADFGKIRLGRTRLDPLFGIAQNTVLLTRLGWMAMGDEDRAVKSATTKQFRALTREDVWNVLDNKLSPALSLPSDLILGEKFKPRKPQGTGDRIFDLVTPLVFRDIKEAIEEHGFAEGSALGLLAFLGMSIQTYGRK